jgi:hypothetical protein
MQMRYCKVSLRSSHPREVIELERSVATMMTKGLKGEGQRFLTVSFIDGDYFNNYDLLLERCSHSCKLMERTKPRANRLIEIESITDIFGS